MDEEARRSLERREEEENDEDHTMAYVTEFDYLVKEYSRLNRYIMGQIQFNDSIYLKLHRWNKPEKPR